METLETRKGPYLRYGLGKTLLGCVGFAILSFAVIVGFIAFTMKASESQVDTIFGDTDPNNPFTVLRTSFPDDYAVNRANIETQLRSSRSIDAATARAIAQSTLNGFIAGHSDDMQQAPSAELDAFRAANAAMSEAASRESPERCAGLINSGALSAGPILPATQEAISALMSARLRAAAAGVRAPARRRTELRGADILPIYNAMTRSGSSDADIRLYQNPDALAAAPAADQCRVLVSFDRALASLPSGDSADAVASAVIRINQAPAR
jgi:hypothetical protein